MARSFFRSVLTFFSSFIANAVSRIDNLSFLEDIVPRTTTYREFKSRKARANQESAPLQNGQTTLDSSSNRTPAQRPAIQSSPIDVVPAASRPGTEEDRAVHASPNQPHMPNGQQLIFEHYEPNGNARRDESGDVEME